MSSSHSDNAFLSGGISPTLRTGPRPKVNAASADEIIRFVRERQKYELSRHAPDPSDSSSGPALRRKSVLPAIGGRSSRVDSLSVYSSCNVQDSLDPYTITDPSLSVSVSDSGFVDKISDHPDSNSEENCNEDRDILFSNDDDFIINDEDGDHISGLEPMLDPFRYKQGVKIARGRNGSIFEDNDTTQPLNAHSVFAEDQLVSSRTRRSSKILDNLMISHNGSKSSFSSNTYLTNKSTPSKRFAYGVSKVSKLLRPRLLPQLPPIAKNDLPARPSAPSPSLTPPSPRSPIDLDALDDSEDDYFDNDDAELNDMRHPSSEPVDYIDCP